MKKAVKIILIVIGAIVFISFFFGGGLEEQAQKDINNISSQVARDAEKQYEIAKNNGEDMDAYVQAGMVSAAYLQANDEANYKKWKEIEKAAGKKIGL